MTQHTKQIFFQRLNYVMALMTGRSFSALFRLKSLSMKVISSSNTQSGSGNPDGVKYSTMRQIKQRNAMYRIARNQRLIARIVTMAENNEAHAHRWRLYDTVLSMRVLSFRILELYLAIDSLQSIQRKFILLWIGFYIVYTNQFALKLQDTCLCSTVQLELITFLVLLDRFIICFIRMKGKLLILALVIVLIVPAFNKDSPEKWFMLGKEPEVQQLYEQKQYLFDQVVDHASYQNATYFKQRYWVVNDYFKPNAGPVFLFICGEYTCPGVPAARQWVITLAQRTMGLVLVVEHRFYGQSLPFGNNSFKLENMKLLTSEQALSDLAYFISTVNENKMYGVNGNPWITIGGSYPGAMSAWFRYKYPHLTIGAIASSAVVQAIEDFKDFDEQMYLSTNKSGDYCWHAINNSNAKVEEILNSGENQAFKRQFQGGQNLKDDEFLFFWIDSIVGQIQYGQRSKMCNALKLKSLNDQFAYFVDLAKQNTVYEYGSYYLKNESFALENGQGSRSWYYQSCTEFGFWQTPSAVHPLRSSRLGINFYKRFCADTFGEGTWPKVGRKNTETGGWNLKAFNLIMTNGDEDPWKWASVQKSQGNIIARVANCIDCAHCVDLYTPSTSDSAELKKIRDEQYLTIQEWIQEYWRNNKTNKMHKALQIDLMTE